MSYFKNIVSAKLFKISTLNALSVAVRILGGLIGSKLIAKYLGPGGLAITENFRNFLTSLEVFSTLGFQNGVVKYVAQNDKNNILGKVLSTIILSIFTGIILISVILFSTAGYWNYILFNNSQDFLWIFKFTQLSLPWLAGSIVLISIINGFGLFAQVIKINIISNIIGVALSFLLILKFGVHGAMAALLCSPAIIFMLSLYYLNKKVKGLGLFKFSNFNLAILKGLLNYSFMALISALLGPFVNISIRNNIIAHFSLTEAGYWASITRLSVFYLMFITTLLSVYFLPKLSKSISVIETKSIIISYYKLILPLFIIGTIILYALRTYIVSFLFSDDFLPMANLFLWQLLGDFFKVVSFILAYEFFAKKMTKAFLVTEILSYCILYFSGMYLTQYYGSEGAVMAHAFTYLIYMIVLIFVFRNIIFLQDIRND